MRIGQTSFLVFISKLFASIVGFVATIYFARLLGAQVLGYYAVVLAVVSWLKLGGTGGISEAIVKRVSEDRDPSEYFTAGALAIFSFSIIVSAFVILFNSYVDDYVGVEVWYFIIILTITGLLSSFVSSSLKGEQKVHIAGLLTPLNVLITSIIQISLVFSGYGLQGMIIGYIIGEIIVAVVAVYFLTVDFKQPSYKHFKRLFDFSKYSWLAGLKRRAHNDIDILILGAFVSPSLVGIYSVAWSISKFLTLFAQSVRTTLFPTISHADASGEIQKIENLVEESLAFVGLIAIPGFFGGTLISERLLFIYGEEFTQGTIILSLLILSTLVYSFQQQMTGAIKAIDRPEIAFRVNLIFIITNVVLNLILIFYFGWVGAAVATVTSAAIALIISFHELRVLLEFKFPYEEIGRQFGAAVVMSFILIGFQILLESFNILEQNIVIVVVLVTLGAGSYFTILFVISTRFRETVISNIPFEINFSCKI